MHYRTREKIETIFGWIGKAIALIIFLTVIYISISGNGLLAFGIAFTLLMLMDEGRTAWLMTMVSLLVYALRTGAVPWIG